MTWVMLLALMIPAAQASQQPEHTLMQEGIQALQRGEDASAESIFRRVLAMDPRSAAAYCNLGVIYLRARRTEDAIAALENAQRLTPEDIGIDINLGIAFFRAEQFDAAIQHLSKVVAQTENVDSRYLLGLSYFRLNRYAQTIDTLKPIERQEERNPFYFYAMLISQQRLDHTAQAERAFDQFQQSDPGSSFYHLLLGKIYLDGGKNVLAAHELKEAAKMNDSASYVHLLLGLAYRCQGMYQEAEREYHLEIQHNPTDPITYLNLGELYLEAGNPQNAIETFDEALKIHPDLPGALVGMGRAYFAQNQLPTAIDCLSRAAKTTPDNVQAHFFLSRALRRSGQEAESEREQKITQQLLASGRALSDESDSNVIITERR